jgi:endonuclease-3
LKLRDKADRIGAVLDEIHPAPPIPLAHQDPFSLLVAVMLSAQTTDARVNLVTPGLFRDAPDAATMAALPVEKILAHIKTCGLAPTKAKNVKETARRIATDHGGVVPRDLEALESLPGVGHKTASVVVSQAFGIPAFPVDTHIHRLAWRWGLSPGTNVVRTEADLKRLYPPDAWNRLHLQIIYFGRSHCPARGHEPDVCPICSFAMSKARRREELMRAS